MEGKTKNYSLELLERIDADLWKAVEIEQKKDFDYKNHHYNRLIKIINKMGFWCIHDFNDQLEKQRKEKQLREQKEYKKDSHGVPQYMEIGEMKQKGDWVYQELTLL